LKFLDANGKRDMSDKKHHWLSELIFEKFLEHNLPNFKSKSYKDVLASLSLIDG
jgi:hypothetical protein